MNKGDKTHYHFNLIITIEIKEEAVLYFTSNYYFDEGCYSYEEIIITENGLIKTQLINMGSLQTFYGNLFLLYLLLHFFEQGQFYVTNANDIFLLYNKI